MDQDTSVTYLGIFQKTWCTGHKNSALPPSQVSIFLGFVLLLIFLNWTECKWWGFVPSWILPGACKGFNIIFGTKGNMWILVVSLLQSWTHLSICLVEFFLARKNELNGTQNLQFKNSLDNKEGIRSDLPVTYLSLSFLCQHWRDWCVLDLWADHVVVVHARTWHLIGCQQAGLES